MKLIFLELTNLKFDHIYESLIINLFTILYINLLLLIENFRKLKLNLNKI